VTPFRYPVVDSIIDEEEKKTSHNVPIVSTSTILIQGKQLRSDSTSILINGTKSTPAPGNLTDSVITISLPSITPAVLRAGVQEVQIVENVDLGDPLTHIWDLNPALQLSFYTRTLLFRPMHRVK